MGKQVFPFLYLNQAKRSALGTLTVKNRGQKQRQVVLPLIFAGMMELVDMRDLGAVTSGKVFPFAARTEKLNTRA